MVLHCVSSDRQSVSLARQLFNKANAVMFRHFFPTDESKLALADIIDTVDAVCDLYECRQVFENKQSKDALGVHLESQTKVMMKLFDLMNNLKFDGRKMQFQSALKISIKSALDLHKYLASSHNVPWLILSLITQDHLESLFGVIKVVEI